MAALTIAARDPRSLARAGVLRTAHGDVRTPAFVPLATKATVKGLLPEEVARLGYEMVLGNTFHLLLRPGEELIERLGGLHRFMGWERPIITDSGGFQVFSMGHGTVADEIKGARRAGARDGARERTGAILEIDEDGVRFRSYVDGGERFLSPGELDGGAGRARLGHRARVRRVHAVPRRPRLHRALDRAHPPLAGALPALARRARARAGSSSTGSCRAASTRTCAAPRRRPSPRAAATGSRSAARWGREGADVRGRAASPPRSSAARDEALPRHLLGIGEVDDLIRGVELGIDTFDCAMPTRLGRHGIALVPDPEARWRLDLTKGRWRERAEPLLEGCPCPACARRALARLPQLPRARRRADRACGC